MKRNLQLLVASLVSALLVLSTTLALGDAVAVGALAHQFLPSVSEHVGEGVPPGSSVASIGPLEEVTAAAAYSGRVWLGERSDIDDVQRLDAYDASSGLFVSPWQLNEAEGLPELGFAGLAVGRSGGEEDVYVTTGKEGKAQIAVFDAASRKLRGVWNGAGTTEGFAGLVVEGEMKEGIAVDGSAGPETSGDVYVASNGGSFKGVYVFAPEAGGGEPAKPLATITGTCVSPGLCSGSEVVPFSVPRGVTVSGFNGDVLVADGNPEECRRGERQCGVDVFEPVSGMPGVYSYLFKIASVNGVPFTRIGGMAVDSVTGNIYVAEQKSNVMDEFSAAGTFLDRIAAAPVGPGGEAKAFPSIQAIAVDSASGNVFVATKDEEKSVNRVDVFARGVVVPDVASEQPSEVGARGARLNGKLNPDSEGEASCRFAWGVGSVLDRTAACEPEMEPNGSTLVAVHARLEGLEPDTEYCYRLQAANGNGTNEGEPSQNVCFTTLGPGLHGESVSEVSATSARLLASIAPHGAQTSYYFQYGRDAGYEAQIPVTQGAPIGSGGSDVDVEQHLQGLVPATTYHFRVVAVSEVNPGEPEAFLGSDRTFRTQPAGAAVTLPDGRQWELVSPADKRGAVFKPNTEAPTQAASGGNAMTYIATVPTEAGVKGYEYDGVQVLSVRGPDGWTSRDVSLPHTTVTVFPSAAGKEYRYFSPDLSTGVAEPLGPFTSLAPEAFPADTDRTPYLRHDTTCEATPATCYEPLVTSAPGYADVPEGTPFGGVPEGEPNNETSEAKFAGASPDLTHVILNSSVALTGASTGGHAQLYEWTAASPHPARLRLVSVLPPNEKGEEASAAGNTGLGYNGTVARRAISNNGSRIVWTEARGNGSALYMRDMARGRTLRLDVPQAECLSSGECGAGAESPRYQTAAGDDARVFFTDTQRLTANASTILGERDLYECEIVVAAGEPRCDLTDLTPGPAAEEGADVQGGVVGASDDGTWLYFVANGILGDGAEHGAVSGNCGVGALIGTGSCNLYVWHEGAVKFIAVLSGEDYPDWDGSNGGSDLTGLTAGVSPNGKWLAFMSNRSLTGYDNLDAHSGRPDEEVYLYHAETSDGAGLVCASCGPTGARPDGIEYADIENMLTGGFLVWSPSNWIAANIPAWASFKQETGLYQPRYLSDQGRVFFNSGDALSPGDINGNQDAYEYEPVGVGDCAASSASFSERSNGCVGLISSGTAIGESAFLDASESGDDVFFLTREKLVAGDIDTALDVYDAHVCSAAALCALAPPQQPACTTADACREAPEPQPAIFGAPSSATFTGAGNVSSPAAAVVKRRSLTRAQKLERALNACHEKKSTRKRRGCERQARNRYGTKKPGKKATRRGRS